MKINFDYKGKNLMLVYGDNGILEHIINTETNEKMMIEYTQNCRTNINLIKTIIDERYVPSSFFYTKIKKNLRMSVCSAVYVRIIELDVFIPKFIFIPKEQNLK